MNKYCDERIRPQRQQPLTTTSLRAETENSRREKGTDALTTVPGYVKPGLMEFPDELSDEWELDCYSRPVLGEDGRKLWELLITDSQSDFKFIKTIPSNVVNSRNLRKAVEEVIELSPVRPKTIRFFQKSNVQYDHNCTGSLRC